MSRTIRCWLKFLLLWVIFCAPVSKNAAALTSDDSKLIAHFIYNIVDYISLSTRDVLICSYGHDEVSEDLLDIAKYQSDAASQLHDISKIAVKDNIRMNDIPQCNILYFAQYQERFIPEALDRIGTSPILTVSNIEHFVDLGGMMEFKIFRQKLKLRLNKDTLEKRNIVLSPVILMSVKPG